MPEDTFTLPPDNTSTGPVPVSVAAAHLGITERAVRKRIGAGRLRGVQVDRRWLVYLPGTEPPGEPESVPERAGTPEQNRNTNPVPGRRTGEDTAAAIIREAIAPFVAQLAATHEELGEARSELHHERTRREEAERARDALQTRVDALIRGDIHGDTGLPITRATDAAMRPDEASIESVRQSQHSKSELPLHSEASGSVIGRFRRWLRGEK